MKEDFLHYLWKFKKFELSNLTTSNAEVLTIVNSGQYLQLAGPDFFNAQIIIGNQKWAGNIEIHIKSSDWYVHHHEKDEAYDNIILHVVWEHDTQIFRKNNTEIPVLELKKYVSKEVLDKYQSLMAPKSWIYCEKQLATIDDFVWENWKERLFFERLERKSIAIQKKLNETQQDWETVLFCLLAKNFGLNTNGESFLKIAQSIPFSIIRKEGQEVENLESLFLGKSRLLEGDKEDVYFKNLKSRFEYLTHKYNLEHSLFETVEFFKHRPDNFPTIRWSQLANLYAKHHNLFSKLIVSNSVKSIYEIFEVSVSTYWQTHYTFDKESPKKKKTLSKSFIDLIIINTIIPFQFAYSKSLGKEISESLLNFIKEVSPESNAIIQKFNSFKIISKNAFETQSLLQLKNEYCNRSRCLECAIGIELLKNN